MNVSDLYNTYNGISMQMHIDQTWIFIGKNKRSAAGLYPSAISPPLFSPSSIGQGATVFCYMQLIWLSTTQCSLCRL